MRILLRRFLVLMVLMFWQGGFTFYASVVVPVARGQLDHIQQGLITQQVTEWLNFSGAVSLLVLAWDAALSGDPSRPRRRGRWASWLGMVLSLAALWWLHGQLKQFLDPKERATLDQPAFRIRHAGYLWVSTVQWVCALAYAGLTLRAWREEDGGEKKKCPVVNFLGVAQSPKSSADGTRMNYRRKDGQGQG